MAKHPHAELIKQMVDDDTLRATCSLFDNDDSPLSFVIHHPQCDWRLVPPKPKTITIVCNGKTYELPEPMRVAPKLREEYWLATNAGPNALTWYGEKYNLDLLGNSCCYATREAAQQWVDAMAEIRGAK